MPRKDYDFQVSYRKHAGWTAWVLHRASGLLLVLYFILHMFGSNSSQPIEFMANIARNPYVEAVIVIMFAWHAMNGLRIIGMEFCQAAERAEFKKWLVIFTGLAVVISAVGIFYLKSELMPVEETIIIEETITIQSDDGSK